MYIVYACLALPYLAYISVDLNPANWAASVAQLAEHWVYLHSYMTPLLYMLKW